MGRGKFHIRRIENPASRQVTFSKRRGGLLKKANELAVLCDAEVGLIIFSSTGKMFEYASSSMKAIVERYTKYTEGKQKDSAPEHDDEDFWRQEMGSLKREIEHLQTIQKHLTGEDLSSLTMKDLLQLEQQLEMGLNHVRSRKGQLLLEQIDDLSRKGKYLHEESNSLRKKISEVQEFAESAVRATNTGHNIQPFKNKDPQISQALYTPFTVQPSHPNLRDSGNSRTSLQLGLYETSPQMNERSTPQSSDGNDIVEQPQDWLRWT